MSTTLIVGIVQVALFLLRGGFLMIFLSKPLVRGFTTAATVHIITSQIKSFLGIEIKRYDGLFKIPLTFYEIFKNIKSTNLADLLIGSISIFILIILKQLINPLIQKKFVKFPPLPAELIVMVINTGISYGCNLHEKYSVKIIGKIPTGIPKPVVPSFSATVDILPDSLLIAFISIIISISLGKLFAEKSSSSVDANQEILSLGLIHTIGSFFFSFAGAAAPPRTVLNYCYGRSQISGLVSAAILLLTMLWLAPLFTSLTISCLSSIVIVSVLPLLCQLKDNYDWFKLSLSDSLNWSVTFLSSVILSLHYGLVIGIATGSATVLLQHSMSSLSNLSLVSQSDLALDSKTYKIDNYLKNIRIIQINSPLIFINSEKIMKQIKTVISEFQTSNSDTQKKHLIINCSSITNLDISGISCLKSIRRKCEDSRIELYLCNINGNILNTIENIMDFKTLLYPSLQDAICICQNYEAQIINNDSTI